MAGIGTKPSMLSPMVPQAPPLSSVTDIQLPQAQAPQAAPEEELDLEALYAATEAAPAEEEFDMEALYAATEEDPKMDAPTDYNSGGAPFMTRLQGSFTRTDKEMKDFLIGKMGKENVRHKNGEFEIKDEGKWIPYDPASLDIGDVADFGRDVFEEAVATPLTLLTATNPVTAVASRAVGSAAGTAAGDLIAENMLGIERDPSRSKVGEIATSAAFGGVFGAFDSWINGRRAAKALEKSNLVDDAASYASRRIADNKAVIERLAQITTKDGVPLIEQIPGAKGNFALLAQLDPQSPEAREILQRISSDKRMRDAFEFIGQNSIDAVNKFTGELGNLEAKAAGKGAVFVDQVSEIYRAAGKIIGDNRKQFIKEAGDGVVPVIKLEQVLADVAEDVGIYRKGDDLVIPSIEDLVDKGFAGDETTAKTLRKNLNVLFEQVHNGEGKLSAKEIDSLYKRVRRFADTAAKSNRFADEEKKIYWSLRRALSDDFTQGIGTVLDGNAQYKNAMKDYRSMSVAYDDLGSYIDNNGLTLSAIGDNIFGKGNAPGQIKSMQVFLQDKPQMWQDVKGAYLKNLMDSSMVDKAGVQVLDGNAFLLKLKKLSPEAKESLFEGMQNGEKVFEDLIKFTGSVKASQLDKMTLNQQQSFMRRLVGIVTGSSFVQATKGYDTIASAFLDMDNKKLIEKVLSPSGEELLKGLPSREVRAWRAFKEAVKKGTVNAAKSTTLQSQLKQNTIDKKGEKPKE